MNMLRKKLKIYLSIAYSVLLLVLISKNVASNEIAIEIKGNKFTDKDAIYSLIDVKPDKISEDYTNYLLKELDNSMLFESVTVEIVDSIYVITIKEFSNINKLYFTNNERLKDEDLLEYAKELNLSNTNPNTINNFVDEIKKLYESFGYNNINIEYFEKKYSDTNTSDVTFDIVEGQITKINKIIFSGNNEIESQELRQIIQSKTKTLINFLANNNFKKFAVENDIRKIKNYYINNGFINNQVSYQIEYLKNNKVNIYFNIKEGSIYYFEDIQLIDNENILNNTLKNKIDKFIDESVEDNEKFSSDKINNLNKDISNLIFEESINFFELSTLEKIENTKISIIFELQPIKPKYANQINVYGNSRTFDRVIRRELEISEGDAVYKNQLNRIQKKLRSLRLFKSVEVTESQIDEDLVDININVEETQTGTFNAGVSVGTIDGVGVVAGLSERNFYGTGRSLKALINTTSNKTQFTFETTDRLFYENNVDITYRSNYKEEDFARASSYKLNTFLTGLGVAYDLNPKLRHSIDFDYVIKDYTVTDSSTVATSIGNSEGENVSFVLRNNLYYSTLNSLMLPKDGNSLNYNNFIETPSSSSNGFVKNIITLKNYNKINNNIISIQAQIGNVISLNDNDILTDDKFSLGGRWLRGFDVYGAGPRNSRTSYVGGNNIITTKFDYSREITKNSDNPLYINLFNDYGLLWENKTKPTNNDNSLRSSFGFGIKYYSIIGPIGFSWGFPVMDEEYDIKRMFLFSVGNID